MLPLDFWLACWLAPLLSGAICFNASLTAWLLGKLFTAASRDAVAVFPLCPSESNALPNPEKPLAADPVSLEVTFLLRTKPPVTPVMPNWLPVNPPVVAEEVETVLPPVMLIWPLGTSPFVGSEVEAVQPVAAASAHEPDVWDMPTPPFALTEVLFEPMVMVPNVLSRFGRFGIWVIPSVKTLWTASGTLVVSVARAAVPKATCKANTKAIGRNWLVKVKAIIFIKNNKNLVLPYYIFLIQICKFLSFY